LGFGFWESLAGISANLAGLKSPRTFRRRCTSVSAVRSRASATDRSEDGGDELVGVAVENQERMVDVLTVNAMIGAALVVAMHWIIGAIHVQHLVTRRASPLVLVDVQRQHRPGHGFTGLMMDGVLEARVRGLRSEIGVSLGKATTHGL
jgi:hypothetical protein